MASSRRDRLGAIVSWNSVDTCPWLTPFALLGLIAGAGMAVFGLPPVDVHGPLHRFGIMDPLCGMIRAVVAALRFHLAKAWAYNPALFALLAVGGGALARAVRGYGTGRWLAVRIPRSRITVGAFAIAVAVLWLNQQHHAALLMRR